MTVKILLVDDDINFVDVLGLSLKANGYEVLVAYDGIRAVGQAREHKPDLIILDIWLPGGSGFKVYKSIKQNLHTFAIPIIFITGFSQADLFDQAEVRKAFEKLGNPFLIKPFTGEELLEKIKSILKYHPAVPSPPKEKEREISPPPPSFLEDEDLELEKKILRMLERKQ